SGRIGLPWRYANGPLYSPSPPVTAKVGLPVATVRPASAWAPTRTTRRPLRSSPATRTSAASWTSTAIRVGAKLAASGNRTSDRAIDTPFLLAPSSAAALARSRYARPSRYREFGPPGRRHGG